MKPYSIYFLLFIKHTLCLLTYSVTRLSLYNNIVIFIQQILIQVS